MTLYDIEEGDRRALKSAIEGWVTRYGSPQSNEFLEDGRPELDLLPRSLRKFLHEFARAEPSPGYCVVSGFPVDQSALGPTPDRWDYNAQSSRALTQEFFLTACSMVLGEVFGWATQQGGKLINDVFPIRGHEDSQMSSGSTAELTWHTEDAFHPYRADFLALMCLRNPDSVPTTVGSVDSVSVPEEDWNCLSRPAFIIKPDYSHTAANNPGSRFTQTSGTVDFFARMRAMESNPSPVAVLFGSALSPYLRIDPSFMGPVENASDAEALRKLESGLESAMRPVSTRAGDILFIDNLKAVHGRKSFHARYDGSDRWLKRVNITLDLRKSRERQVPESPRLLY